jgi:hypothetical protein
MDRHEADGLCQVRVRSRFTNHLVIEGAPIKRLMLHPYGRKQMVGVEVLGRHPANSGYGIGQPAMDPGKVLVGNKAGWIDDDFAGVEFGLQNIGKDIERGKVGAFSRAYVNTD